MSSRRLRLALAGTVLSAAASLAVAQVSPTPASPSTSPVLPAANTSVAPTNPSAAPSPADPNYRAGNVPTVGADPMPGQTGTGQPSTMGGYGPTTPPAPGMDNPLTTPSTVPSPPPLDPPRGASPQFQGTNPNQQLPH